MKKLKKQNEVKQEDKFVNPIEEAMSEQSIALADTINLIETSGKPKSRQNKALKQLQIKKFSSTFVMKRFEHADKNIDVGFAATKMANYDDNTSFLNNVKTAVIVLHETINKHAGTTAKELDETGDEDDLKLRDALSTFAALVVSKETKKATKKKREILTDIDSKLDFIKQLAE